MYKTEIIKGVKDTKLRSEKLAELINDQAKNGWDFESAIHAHKYDVIAIFKENPSYKLNQDINKGIKKVTSKFNKVVDAINSKE
ncbi:hypothetical protein [Acholeplasma laidlawii]|nr:hypothetical protein [Acholeplasma laidlawii]NWH09736.1 hypothetical protein [Acholeplasma laidlawii]NWH11128.1 hypothetical protein [Acholeplasma laidlawii]NWH13461.1 hypothetical protein [Acholeplasma laidlawii]NWH14560.1 hypothetical protein [Acholeplasma laidlawii]OAN19690.1 hypothetical protein A2I99_04650 [Acholeplasma laidlawii]